jgi:hypothetical protein
MKGRIAHPPCAEPSCGAERIHRNKDELNAVDA